MSIKLIDPTVSPVPYRYTIANRPANLDHPVVGLIDNGKPNADKVLSGVADRLAQTLDLTLERVEVRKPHASRVLPADQVDLIARRCHFALVGVGD